MSKRTIGDAPMSYAEKIAYARGYNRGRSRMFDYASRAVEIAKGYRLLSRRPEDSRVCSSCSRWERGCPTCSWGKCAASFEFGLEGRMWADQFVGEKQPRAVITSEEFGCVNWLPKP